MERQNNDVPVPGRGGDGELSDDVANAAPTAESLDGVDALQPGMAGRWEVHARTSTHIWDLDAMVYTRLPGDGATHMPYDEQPMPITRVERWPAVGDQSMVFFDDAVDGGLEHWRICSRIRRIVPATSACSSPKTPGPRRYRFHRPLTDAELAGVLAACRDGGMKSGMAALWDVILQDAEGVTWNEANEEGQRFEPGHYAIPAQQAEAVRIALEHHGADFLNVASTVAMAWFDIGPATF